VFLPRHHPPRLLAPWVIWTALAVVLLVTAAVDLMGWFLD
jgi:hypothetical protein